MADRKKVYSEKLRDPRWQKRRLEIFQRDDFSCQICQDTTSTLHVHHRRYVAGREPWEYEDRDLVTLCESCHGEEQTLWPQAVAQLTQAFISMGYFSFDVGILSDAIFSSGYGHPQHFLSIVKFLSENEEAYEMVSKRFHDHINLNGSDAVTPARTASE